MPELQQAVAEILSRVDRPGSFYASGIVDIHLPGLTVEGVGTLALPLLPVQAEALITVAEQAPYGRGTETLVDTAVRRTWQIDAARIHISGRRWTEDLDRIVQAVSEGLGVRGQVQAEPYKLLLYDTGSFFVSHRDTEKAPGMFATLVLALPSEFSGGELVIRHKHDEVRLDLRRDEPSEITYAAFYADCRHEVLPVESGYRWALVYNLVRPDGGPLPEAPDHDRERRQLAELLRHWGDTDPGAGPPHKLIFPLEHSYTEAELGFDALKGVDTAVAGVMLAAAEDADFDLQLALVTIGESGWAEYTGGGYWRDAEPEFEIGEVDDTWRHVHTWRLPDGSTPDMGHLSFEDDEVCPPDAFADMDSVEPDFEEATGNAGATFERLYQRAALVVWPRRRRALVLAQGGLNVSVPYLSNLLARLKAEPDANATSPNRDELRQQAFDLAACIRESWPETGHERLQASQRGLSSQLLEALCQLDEAEAGATFIAEVCAAGGYTAEDNAAILRTCANLPAERAASILHLVIAGNAHRDPAACAQLLARCTEQLTDLDNDQLRPAALALLAALPAGKQTTGYFASAPPPPSADLVLCALLGLSRVDDDLAERALRHCLDRPSLYDPDSVLLPAALAVASAQGSSPTGAEPPALAGLRHAVLRHLEARIAEPLAPPPDWQRPAEVRCRCTDCTELNRFLASPMEPSWRLKAAEPKRRHVEDSIRTHRCDVDTHTDAVGRPYTLVCTKNQASYERRVEQRKKDLANRERLSGSGGG